jgi:hypothetical protein
MKQRKQLTPEQEARRAEKRAKVREYAARIKGMTAEQRLEFCSRAGLTTVETRQLSPFNQCLVLFQNPGATVVGGFRQWLKHGRAVRKGEHGMSIWVPVGHKNEEGELDEKTGFVAGTVFDVSQTAEIESEVTA